MLVTGMGFFLFHMREHLPLLLTFVVGNMLVMLTAVFGLLAHCRLLGARVHPLVYALPFTAGLVGAVASYAFAAPHTAGVAAVSGAMAILFGATVVLLVRAAFERLKLVTVVSAAVLASLSAALVLRVFVSVFGNPADISPSSTATSQVGLFLLGLVYVLTTSLWIFDTVHDRQRRDTQEAARRDGLTGLYTRTAFFELASNLVGRRGGRPCAVVMADIDHFKAINDTLGHAAGDTTLAHAARLIAGAVRLSDIVGRYGGEEFCILLPDCTSHQAGELAARLVDEAARQKVRHRDGRCIEYTISAGYATADIPATLDDPTELLSALLEQADQALYRAKNEGRNRAVAAPEQVILNPAVRSRPRVSEEALAAR